MLCGSHINEKAYEMANVTMSAYSQLDHLLPRWECVLQYCAKCPSIYLTDQETDYQYTDTVLQFIFTFIICLHVVQNMAGFR